MDLTTEGWLPVVTQNNTRLKIPLANLLDDNIVDVSYPRADFQGAAWQMLIGLLQTTVAPEDEPSWREVWKNGIDKQAWQQALSAVAPAMQFGAEKPAFLQSFEPLESESSSIAGLLIDAPGGNTLKLNKDHFVKRHVGQQICPHCAVMALFAVQTNSPAGGAGYRVGLRGGGPLTTLVVPQQERDFPLWKKLWLNVIPEAQRPTPSQYAAIFPWLAPTKTSDKAGNIVTPDNAHVLQAYWGMPRRIEVDFETTIEGSCDLCGEQHPALLREMRTKNYGVQYDGWRHPLSPYRQALKDQTAPWLALKGQPGGLSYKDWLGLTLNSEDKFNRMQPARVVQMLPRRLPATGLWCFAWDMDNAKARCWYQHRIPLVNTSDSSLLSSVMQQILQLASDALRLLKQWLKAAWFPTPSEAKADFSLIEIAFWQETEPAFRRLLETLAGDPARKNLLTRDALREWETRLHHDVIHFFDREVFTDPDCDDGTLLRQLTARSKLDRDYDKLKTRTQFLDLAKEGEEQNA